MAKNKYDFIKELLEDKKLNQNQQEYKKETLEKNKQNKNTSHPAHHPTANKYISGSGWEILHCCLFKFIKAY